MKRSNWVSVWVVVLAWAGGAIDSALATRITERQCVPSNPKAVHGLFTRYDRYPSLPGAEYAVRLAGTQVPLMRWVKSQSKPVLETPERSHHYVWTVLQPVNLTDSALYPRFLLDCRVEWQSGATGFRQECRMMREKQRFGLDDLQIQVQARSGDSSCKANETLIDIQVDLVSNPSEVSRIKAAVLGPAGFLAPLLEPLFNEEAFFQNYFRFVYGEWMKTL
jgi:hypothetical protein